VLFQSDITFKERGPSKLQKKLPGQGRVGWARMPGPDGCFLGTKNFPRIRSPTASVPGNTGMKEKSKNLNHEKHEPHEKKQGRKKTTETRHSGLGGGLKEPQPVIPAY
jgi:hypothetical protein